LVGLLLIFVVAGGSKPLNYFDSNRFARISAEFKFRFSQLYPVGSTDLVPVVPRPSIVPAPRR
jgi:hypothetical protein